MERIKTLFRKKSTRLVAMMCVVALIIGLVPTVMFMRSSSAAAWDGSTKTQPSGSGTEADPYLIANGANLAWVAGQTNGTNGWSEEKYFKQTEDIDLGSKSWTPIGGDSNRFNGVYDGCGYEILNLYINSSLYSAVGLFGGMGQGTIKNVHIKSGSIKNTSSFNYAFSGSILGINDGIIIGCSNMANISNSNGNNKQGDANSGGIAGTNSGKIICCSNKGTVTASSYTNSNVGGLAGYGTGKIISSYNTGSVSASSSGSGAYKGGILGSGSCELTSCYWLQGQGVSYILGIGTSTTGKSTVNQLTNSDGKNTIVNAMNDAIKTYYDANSDVTDHFFWTYKNSTDSYPVAAKKTPSKDDLNVGTIANKAYDGDPVTVTVTTKSTGMGSITVKYNGSATAPSEPGTYSVTVDVTEGVDYRAGTITLGSFTISKGTLSKDNFNDELGMPKNNSKVYDGEPVVITATLKSGLLGANNLSAVKYNGETTPPTDVGTYKATVEMKGSSAWNDGTVELGTFEITKATVSASDIDPGKINDFLYSMELSSNTPAANKYGYYSWENATSLATTRGPGEHTLIFTPKDIKNYDWSNIDGWTLNADSQTLSKTFTVNTVYVPERQIVVYFNKNAMK